MGIKQIFIRKLISKHNFILFCHDWIQISIGTSNGFQTAKIYSSLDLHNPK